ncbi:hypothetical protein DFJ73DRAFT_782129 [Zopfochytrium polystomum]|nr:hypothetical protein DFJ73DRAFT_782129 [Zopfochytrium polystomum]
MAALLLQHRGKNLSFAEVKTAFQNTAVPAKRYQSSLIDSVALQGASFLNIYDAATTTTVVSPSFLALNDSVHIKDSYTLMITNKDITPVCFTLTQVGTATANPFNGVEDIVQPRNTTTFTSNHAIVGFGSNRQATLNTPSVPPNSSVNVTVHFSPPPTASPSLHPLYSGHLVVSRYGNATPVARVPYAGVVGNWTAAHILAVSSPSMVRPAGFYLPASTQGNATTFTAITAGATVNLTAHNIALWNSFAGTTRNGIAVVVYTGSDAATRASLVALGLMDAGNRDQGVLKVRGEDGGDLLFMYNDFSARNAPFAGQSVGAPLFYYWGGEVYASESADTYVKLPAGEYKLRLKGLRHFRPRFAQDDADFHIVETPTFHLVY